MYVERVGLVTSKKGKPTGSVIDRYQYPIQEMEIRPKDTLKLTDGKAFGEARRAMLAEVAALGRRVRGKSAKA